MQTEKQMDEIAKSLHESKEIQMDINEIVTVADAEDSTQKPSDIHPQTLSILQNTLEICRIESENNKLIIPLENCEGRVKLYTGYPITLLPVGNVEPDDSTFKNFDISERITLTKIFYKFYSEKKTPSYQDVYKILSNALELPDYNQFCLQMYLLGFHYMPTDIGWMISEDPKLKFHRFHYLNKIRKYREENKAICYFNEKIITGTGAVKNVDKQLTVDQVIPDGLVFLSAISDKEVKSSLICNKLSKDLLKKWFASVLLKELKPESVIIFEDKKLHGELSQKTITQHHSKQEMLKWLRLHNVPCSDNMHKVELYELTQKIPKDDMSYDVDQLFKAYDHNVLRLPFKCNNLSITELMWNEFKTDLSIPLYFSEQPSYINDQIISKVNILLKERWEAYEKTIIDWENEMFNVDLMSETVLDKSFIFDVEKMATH